MNPETCIFGPEIGRLLDLQRRLLKRKMDNFHRLPLTERVELLDLRQSIMGGTRKPYTPPPAPTHPLIDYDLDRLCNDEPDEHQLLAIEDLRASGYL